MEESMGAGMRLAGCLGEVTVICPQTQALRWRSDPHVSGLAGGYFQAGPTCR